MNVCSVIWFEVYLGFFVLYGVYWLSINNIGLIINYVNNSVVRDIILRYFGLFLLKLWNINWFVIIEIKINVRYKFYNV